MESPRFINHYRPVINWLLRSGLPLPWLKKSSVIISYDISLFVLVSFTIWCYTYTVMTGSIAFQVFCLLSMSYTLYVNSVLTTLYFLGIGERLKLITEDMDRIAQDILRSGLNGGDLLEGPYKKNAKLMALLSGVTFIISLMSPTIYCASEPITGHIMGNYREKPFMYMELPYDVTTPVVYELLVIQITCSIAVSTAKKSMTDCLFVSLFKIQTVFLKFLTVSKDSLKEEFLNGDSELISRKIKTWAKLHQDILRNIENLIKIFSPVVIMYSVTVVNVVVFGAFVQVKKDDDNIVQSVSAGAYVVVTLIYYFLLSDTANQLTDEAQKLAFVIYSTPWYEMKKRNANMIQFIITTCNRPIEVAAYRAPIFLLNRETFAGFLVSAISVFVTFCQIKDVYG